MPFLFVTKCPFDTMEMKGQLQQRLFRKKIPASPWLFYSQNVMVSSQLSKQKEYQQYRAYQQTRDENLHSFSTPKKNNQGKLSRHSSSWSRTPAWKGPPALLICPRAANSLLCQGSSTDTCGPWKTNPVPLPVGFRPPKVCIWQVILTIKSLLITTA